MPPLPSFAGIETFLPGQIINGRWKVGSATGTTDPNATGGFFSKTFHCTDITTGKPVFLKVVDVFKAISRYSGTMPISDILVKIGQEHRFESNLMEECKEARLRRVVIALDSGDTTIPGYSGPVMFLVFELAEGDTHKIKDATPALAIQRNSDKWWLDTLHCVATGLFQLHGKMIAHQDVKPSNILFFKELDAKIADLGRAVKKNKPNGNQLKNGDINHSPPEIYYGMRASEWGVRYLAVDLYMLGNLLYFHFLGGFTLTNALIASIEPTFHPYTGVAFNDALPALEEAFGRIIVDFRDNRVNHLPAAAADGLTEVLVQLCQPNPEKRGHPRDHAMKHGPKYSTQRYISRFNTIRHMIP
jgi:serine/threonine protein kinase